METSSVSLLVAFAAGVASFASPCVLPLVPSYITYITGVTLEEFNNDDVAPARRRAALHAGLFILGFSLLFIVLGASATALGSTVRRLLPAIQQIGGAVIVLFGLVLLGLVRIPLLMREKRVQLSSKPAGMIGSVVAGIAFGAGWTPCIGPVLASILLYAGMETTMLHGTALLAVYALGLGIPFFIAAVAFNWFLLRMRSLRRWLRPIEQFAGVIMIVVGVMLFSGKFTVLTGFLAR